MAKGNPWDRFWWAAGNTWNDITGANKQADAIKQAAKIQAGAAQSGIDVQTEQFNQIQELLKPFVTAGTGALTQQQNLIGLGGPEAQQQALSGIQSSPEFASMMAQGENAILQNASATGGLRGGNTQVALSQFRPQLLNQLINQQYSRLGGISGMGLGAATGQGQFGSQYAGNVGNLLGQQGAAQAGAILGANNAYGQSQGVFGNLLGMAAGGLLGGVPGATLGSKVF